MTITDNIASGDSAEQFEHLLGRAIARGIHLRRRKRFFYGVCTLALLCAAIIPLTFSLGQSARSPLNGTMNGNAYALVSWKSVQYPGLNVSSATYPAQLGCNPGNQFHFQVDVQQVSYMQPADSNATLAVVLVKCDTSTPTPSSLYVFEPGTTDAQPELLQVLLAPPDPQKGDVLWYADSFNLQGSTVTLDAKGVSGAAAICCPNVSGTMSWSAEGTHFIEVTSRISPIASSG